MRRETDTRPDLPGTGVAGRGPPAAYVARAWVTRPSRTNRPAHWADRLGHPLTSLRANVREDVGRRSHARAPAAVNADRVGERGRDTRADEATGRGYWPARLTHRGPGRLSGRSGALSGAEVAPHDGLASAWTGAPLVSAIGTGILIQYYLEPGAVDPELLPRALRALFGHRIRTVDGTAQVRPEADQPA